MEALVTVAVIPRERFSGSAECVAELAAKTAPPFEGIVVDGGSPPAVARELRALCEREGFDLLRTDHYLSPNQARNLALSRVRTRYVVFIDNDVIVTPGWLDALVRCAEETGAWVVGPLYCIGTPLHERIHMAGGIAHVEQRADGRHLVEEHCLQNEPLAAHRASLRRGPCELVEFHCLLARCDAFAKLGPLDEALLSSREHIDFCLAVRDAGGEVWFEPDSLLTYVPPPPFERGDVPYYVLRWSDEWARPTYEHFNAKWSLDDDPSGKLRYWIKRHRRVAFADATARAVRLLGERRGTRLADWAIGRIERRMVERAMRRGAIRPS